METEHLDDEALAATAYIWREKARLGDKHAARIVEQLDSELSRRLGPTPSQRVPLETDEKGPRRAWWKFW